MKSRLMSAICAGFFCLSINVNAAELFSDDFSDTAASISKWIFPSSLARTFSNGALTLQNSGATYTWFATHSMTSKAAVFTLSATIASTSFNSIGIACCMNDSSNGIAIQLGSNQTLSASKIGSSAMLSTSNSFITTTVNTLKISKQDSTFNVFCNGHYIATFYVSDSKFINGGNIGLIMPPGATATFDNVVMTDQYETGTPITCFSDDFSDGDLTGWYTALMTGNAKVSGGQMVLTNTSEQYCMPIVNGYFDKASYRVITTYKSGSGPYGLCLAYAETVTGGISYKYYLFLIDSARSYMSCHPDSTGKIIASSPVSYIKGSTGDCKDTLEVLRLGNKYKFRINGNISKDSLVLYGNGAVGLAGVYAYGVSAGFDDFVIGGDSSGASCSIINIAGKNKKNILNSSLGFNQNGYFLFDASGRLVKKLNAGAYGAMPHLPAGAFFIRNSVDKSGDNVKKIIVAK
jgi:hypothetical protein